MRMTDLPVQAQPDGHPHFHAARTGDIAQIDDVLALPAEPFAQPAADLALRGSVVATDKQVVIARNERRVNPDFAVHGIERLHHSRNRKLTLNLLAEGIGVADSQRWGHAFGKIKWVGDMNENLALQIGGTSLAKRGEGIRAVGTVEHDLAERGRVGEGAHLTVSAHAFEPCFAGITGGRARAHHDLMAELNEFGREGVPDHAGAKNCDFHSGVLIVIFDAMCRGQSKCMQ